MSIITTRTYVIETNKTQEELNKIRDNLWKDFLEKRKKINADLAIKIIVNNYRGKDEEEK